MMIVPIIFKEQPMNRDNQERINKSLRAKNREKIGELKIGRLEFRHQNSDNVDKFSGLSNYFWDFDKSKSCGLLCCLILR